MAEKAHRALMNENIPEIVLSAMQLKKRSEQFNNYLYYEGAVTNAGLSVAATGSFSMFDASRLLASGQGLIAAHLGVSTRSGNMHLIALQFLEEALGREFAANIDALPFDKEGIAQARALLFEADQRFRAYAEDPQFDTKCLLFKEMKKGGDKGSNARLEAMRQVRNLTGLGSTTTSVPMEMDTNAAVSTAVSTKSKARRRRQHRVS